MPYPEVAAGGARWVTIATAIPQDGTGVPDRAVEDDAEQLEARVLVLRPVFSPVEGSKSTRNATVRETGGAAHAGPSGQG